MSVDGKPFVIASAEPSRDQSDGRSGLGPGLRGFSSPVPSAFFRKIPWCARSVL